MAEDFFELSREDQRETLARVCAKTESPDPPLLEKEVWVCRVDLAHMRIFMTPSDG